MKNDSLRINLIWQFVIIITLVVIITLGLVWIENSFFLEDYYLGYKNDQLVDLYDEFNDLDGDGRLYEDEYYSEFETICAKGNIALMVVSPSTRVLISTSTQNERMRDNLLRVLFGQGESRLIDSKENYALYKFLDEGTNSQYLVFLGTFSSSNIVFMETPMESITGFVELSKRFILITGLISLLIGFFLAVIFAKRILSPLRTLTDISDKMAQMDFDAKFLPGKIQSEIDVLGGRLNDMSNALLDNITKLKQANIELERDLKNIEENEAARREFISNISHELKSPLGIIVGYSEGLMDGIAEDEASKQEYLTIIRDEAKKMDSSITKLIELDEIEYGQNQIHLSRIDLAKIIHEEVYSLLVLAKNAGITIDNRVRKACFVICDEFLLRQVVNNYLTNAIRYSKEGKSVLINIIPREGRSRLCVYNCADPISDEDGRHIWERFYKIDPARSRDKGGSGIGLSVVKTAAKTLGCECGFHNKDEGVEFYFDFEACL